MSADREPYLSTRSGSWHSAASSPDSALPDKPRAKASAVECCTIFITSLDTCCSRFRIKWNQLLSNLRPKKSDFEFAWRTSAPSPYKRSLGDMVMWRSLSGVVLHQQPSRAKILYNSCWAWGDCFWWGCSDDSIDIYHYTSKRAAKEIQRTGELQSTTGSAVSYVTAFGLGGSEVLNRGVYFTRLQPQDVSIIVNNNYAGGDMYVSGTGRDVKHRHRSAEAVVIVKWPMRRILGRARRMVPDLDAHTRCGYLRYCGNVFGKHKIFASCGSFVGAVLGSVFCLKFPPCGCYCCCCCFGGCLGGCSGLCLGATADLCAASWVPSEAADEQSKRAQPWRRPPDDYLARVSHWKSDVWLVQAAVIHLNLGNDPNNEQKRRWGLDASVHELRYEKDATLLVPPRQFYDVGVGDIRGLPPKSKSKMRCEKCVSM